MKRRHIPKVDTGDDYDFMCGTSAFGATVDARDLCQPCTKRVLEIVDLLSAAYDELAATGSKMPKRRADLMKRIDKALGKRATVAWPKDDETATPANECRACDGDGFLAADADTAPNERLTRDSRVCTYCHGTGRADADPPGTLRIKDVGNRRVITLTGRHQEKP